MALRRLGPSGPLFLARAAALSASLVTVLLTSRALGPEGRGVLATFAVFQLLGSVGLGLGTGAAVYVLTGRGSATTSGLIGALLAWTIVVVATTFGAAAAAQSAGLLGSWFAGFRGPLPLLIAIGTGAQYLATACTQVGMGLSRTGYTAAGLALAPIVVMFGTAWATALSAEPETYVIVLAGGWMTAALLLLAALGTRPTFQRQTLGAVVHMGRAGAIGDIANALSYRLDTLILGALGGIGSVGIYSLAVQTQEPLWIVAIAASSSLLIRRRATEPVQWAAMARRLAFVASVLTAGAVLMTLALLPILVSFVGQEFRASIVAAWALGPGTVFLSASKVLAAYQVGSGRLWLGSLVASVSVGVTTALDLILIPPLGATGAAIASSAGYGVSMALWLAAFARYSPHATRQAEARGSDA